MKNNLSDKADVRQVEDDIDLFDLLIKDESDVQGVWQTPRYWQGYARDVRARLKPSDLKALRRNNGLLAGFAHTG